MAPLNPKLRKALLAAALSLPPAPYCERPSGPQPRKPTNKNRDKIKAARKQRHKSR